MWLKNIPPKILLADLKKKYGVGSGAKYTYNTLIGEYDEPREQKQGPLMVDLAGGNIAIIGKADSSIEKLVSTLIWSSVCDRTPAEIAYYIIDFGTETLKKFAKFPQVGEVVFQDEVDKVAGILSLITDEMDRRKEILSEYNGSFEYYNKTVNEKMPLIEVVINNYDILSETLPRTLDLLAEMFRDAPKYGINFIITTNATNVLGTRLLQFFNHVIVMQINDDTQYRSLTNCRRGLIPKKTVGRGICKIDATSDNSYCEFQTAMIDTEEKELDTIKAYANQCVEYYKCKVKQLTKVPEDMTSEDVAKYVTDLANVPIGFDLYEKQIVKYDFTSSKIHLVTGKDLGGGLPFIYGLATVLSRVPNVQVRIADMLDVFKKPILDVRQFSEDINVVITALKKDSESRTDTQATAVNIIIGAGQYKNYLSDEGIEGFEGLFSGLKNTKNSICILVDDYEKLRSLRLEEWFDDVDTNRGLWLGPELDNQSLFETEQMKSEDSKLNFAGLGFSIDDGEYRVMKTIMDEDK